MNCEKDNGLEGYRLAQWGTIPFITDLFFIENDFN